MRPERALVAERPLAQHCPSVLGRGASEQFDPLPALDGFAAALAPIVARRLAVLTGGDAPAVTNEPAYEHRQEELLTATAPLTACACCQAGDGEAPFVILIEARAVLALVERAFGGRGQIPDPLPDEFPLSADLMAAKLADLMAQSAAEAFASSVARPVTVVRRAASLARLDAFPARSELGVAELVVREPDAPEWRITLAFGGRALAAVFDTRAHRPAPLRPLETDPLGDAFSAMPLTLRATLIDMAVPLATVSTLAPGTVLPVSVAREVPLAIGDVTFARGSVGALDDRVALKLSGTFPATSMKGSA